MSDVCWNCGRELPDVETFGVVTVIHEGGEITDHNVVRRCCGRACARKATVWTVATRAKDEAMEALVP